MTMMTPAADEVDNAIKEKDRDKFSIAFSKLTAERNNCHEATGFGFIKMRDPVLSPIETSPFPQFNLGVDQAKVHVVFSLGAG